MLRWGILGPGWIAQRFVGAVQAHTGQQVVAVGSRSVDRAERFAAGLAIGRAHGCYNALVADPDVDIVYISTPHTEHLRGALDALHAGKHVLVEKPFGLNATQAREIAAAANAAGLFAGEAMWTRFLPKFDVLKQILDSGGLGPITTVSADHGEYFTTDHRIYDPTLAGGPMLDLGTYPIALAIWAGGEVDGVSATGRPANDELNGQISAIIDHTSGAQSVVTTTILSNTPVVASISGRDGFVHLPAPWYHPGPFSVFPRDGEPLHHVEPIGGHVDGLHFSAVDAARSVADGRSESAVHPHADIVATLSAMDAIRAQLGIEFPGGL
ncbi:Gfo/Idh/MocA family protein [Gordonia soli]|uniref:Putative oxidoreductase n=1 Tax=Gordonia soli NBRC 108243 TaxID=1223545 RepID=M0QPC3_9ACTN|nr:putative oxidoreductase [Gordonia soli NBRC 108243]